MNDIEQMPAKCHNCPYWEVCEYPYVCRDIGGEKSGRQIDADNR